MQVGISLVGMSSVLSGEGSSTHKVSTEEMLLGMGLIVASQVTAAEAYGAAYVHVKAVVMGEGGSPHGFVNTSLDGDSMRAGSPGNAELVLSAAWVLCREQLPCCC
jgi:hypothetical protein